MHYCLNNLGNIAGFAAETAGPGEMVKVLTRGIFTSDQPDFYNYNEEISNLFLNKIGLPLNNIYQFLIIIHEDYSADVYLNEFPINMECRVKKSFEKGALIRSCDIADIKKLNFDTIKIKETDKIVCCLKVGWKFGLLFDLGRHHEKLNIDSMENALGELYRYLSFQNIYNLIEADTHFEELLKDGWFPFVELIGIPKFKDLIRSYKIERFVESETKVFVEQFNNEKVNNLVERWWSNAIFYERKDIIMAGINAFLSETLEGYINCIHTLIPQVEGILRIIYFKDTKKGKGVKISELLGFILEKGENISGSKYSLIMAQPFVEYLKKYFFRNFNLESGDIDLSRHSLAHGVAKKEVYTKVKALQLILILDQIYFFV